MTPIKSLPIGSQGNKIESSRSFVLQDQVKIELKTSPSNLFPPGTKPDPQNSLKKLEQLSWNADRTGEVGKWDIAKATNFQTDPQKHPYLNAALRGVNNTAGLVASVENVVTNAAGALLFDAPAAIEDLSVKHGGPSFQEMAVSMQAATPGIPDEALPYAFSKLSRIGRKPVVIERTVIQTVPKEFSLFTSRLEKIPHGFKSEQEFRQFGEEVRKGLRATGIEDGEVFIRGSAVTGVSHETHLPFDLNRVSDFDLAVVSPKLLEKAKRMRVYMRNGGERTTKLNPPFLKKLGLHPLAEKMSRQCGRDVNFMIYGSEKRIAVRGEYIKFPQGEK